MTGPVHTKPEQYGNLVARSAAGLAATGALACAVCCVLPLTLPAAALAITGSTLAWFARLYQGTVYAAALLVAVAWIWVAVQSWRSKRRLAAATGITMLAATAMLALAFSWPMFEHVLLAKLGG